MFLVTRIYEEWHRRGDNREAVTHGLAATGRTITAAAAIMVLVFAAFILGGERVIELFGLGLACAVFLDALVVRSVLVPSLMLLGTVLLVGLGHSVVIFPVAVVLIEIKIHAEEGLMSTTFPDDYPRYRRRVPQLVPGLRLLHRPHSADA